MVVTEAELREMWRNGRQALPAFPPGTRFSPAALDFIKDHRLEISFAEPKPPAGPVPQLPIANSSLSFTLDSLHALTLLAGAEARRYQLPALAQRLDRLANDCLKLRQAEQAWRAAGPLTALAPPAPASSQLLMTNELSPFPPGPADHAILHWLNLLRATARQAAAQAAAGGNAELAAALEQLAAAAVDLGRRVQTGELGWKPAMV
jgi:hypothetical protein